MVLVKSSMYRGTKPFVEVDIIGIATAMQRLRRANIEISNLTELGLVKAGNLMNEEVQESIIGNRAEYKSVDTGRFANSITFTLNTRKNEAIVFPRREFYPDSTLTTQDIARYMEYGTSSIPARRHFRNTKDRNMGKAVEIMRKTIVRKRKTPEVKAIIQKHFGRV